ncbi:MAG: tryptophan 2,3-dioxygenase family protein [Planctomycetota bacterium JB042]
MSDAPKHATTYWDYIRVRELLSLQTGLSDDESELASDEVVFITVHQVYELWFKLALKDLEAARDHFAQPHVPDDRMAGACRKLERLLVIFRLASDHFPLIETLTTRDYLEFRDKLFPANGGQSAQFRELEILFGLDVENIRLPYVTGGSFEEVLRSPDGSTGWSLERVKARQADRPTFREAIDAWLYRTPIEGSTPDRADDAARTDAFIDAYLAAHRKAITELADNVLASVPADEAPTLKKRYEAEIEQAAHFLRAEDVDEAARPRRRRVRTAALYIEIYRELPLLAWPRKVLDLIVAVEQAFVSYRQRHARMAERIIGRRVGTGGSSGVDYLDQTALAYRIFPDLWAVRTVLVRRDLLPDPSHTEEYGFRYGG